MGARIRRMSKIGLTWETSPPANKPCGLPGRTIATWTAVTTVPTPATNGNASKAPCQATGDANAKIVAHLRYACLDFLSYENELSDQLVLFHRLGEFWQLVLNVIGSPLKNSN
jgi:hypothetical protein